MAGAGQSGKAPNIWDPKPPTWRVKLFYFYDELIKPLLYITAAHVFVIGSLFLLFYLLL